MRSSRSVVVFIAAIALLLGSTAQAATPEPLASPSPASAEAKIGESFPTSVDGQSIEAHYFSGAAWVGREDLGEVEQTEAAQRAGDALAPLGASLSSLTIATAAFEPRPDNVATIMAMYIDDAPEAGPETTRIEEAAARLLLGDDIDVRRRRKDGRSTVIARDSALPGSYPLEVFRTRGIVWLLQGGAGARNSIKALLPPPPMIPALVTGTVDLADIAWVEGPWDRGETGAYVDADDPRLRGMATRLYDDSDDGLWWSIRAGRWMLAGRDGSWTGTSSVFAKLPVQGFGFGPDPADPPPVNIETVVLAGEGAYEGLVAHLQFAWVREPPTFSGGIVPAAITEPPPRSAITDDIAPSYDWRPGPVAGEPSTGPETSFAGEVAAYVVDEIDDRTVDLTIDSPAVGVQNVRLLLPARFHDEPDTRWPVPYLHHGLGGNYTEWTSAGRAAELTADLDLLVVMPDADQGWYSDAWNDGSGGPPMWETFHLVELRKLLERDWRASDRRAVAGLSMGGFGAMSYAGRHPELFRAAASFSGPLDTQILGFEAGGVWGDPDEQVGVWAAHNPTKLAAALEGMALLELGP